MKNKKAYVMPEWLPYFILLLIILGIILFFVVGPYNQELTNLVQTKIVEPLSV